MNMNDINDFGKIIQEVDITEFDMLDQLNIMGAYIKMIETVRPIYLKHMVKDCKSSTFLFKL